MAVAISTCTEIIPRREGLEVIAPAVASRGSRRREVHIEVGIVVRRIVVEIIYMTLGTWKVVAFGYSGPGVDMHLVAARRYGVE